MARASKEYIKNLIPQGLPDGREILEAGRKVGPTIRAGRSRLVRDSEFDHYLEYFQDHKERKEIAWFSNVGLATIEEEVEGIKELQRWCKKLKEAEKKKGEKLDICAFIINNKVLKKQRRNLL